MAVRSPILSSAATFSCVAAHILLTMHASSTYFVFIVCITFVIADKEFINVTRPVEFRVPLTFANKKVVSVGNPLESVDESHNCMFRFASSDL